MASAPKQTVSVFLAMLLVILAPPLASGAEAVEVEQIAGGFEKPTAISVLSDPQGDADSIYVADAGSGQVLLVRAAEPEAEPSKLAEVRPRGRTSGEDRPPLALLLLDQRTLLVGVGGVERVKRTVLVLRFSGSGSSVRTRTQQRVRELLPADAGDAAGDYAALSNNGRYVFLAFESPEGGRLLRARHTSGMLSAFRPLSTVRSLPQELNPTAVAVSPQGYVVAAYQSDSGSRLVFADPEPLGGSGEPVKMKLDLPGVVALAYCPKPNPVDHRLYALSADDTSGGLYRLDAALDEDGRMATRAAKLVSLQGATAMAFDVNGTLYATVARNEAEGTSGGGGEILRIRGDL